MLESRKPRNTRHGRQSLTLLPGSVLPICLSVLSNRSGNAANDRKVFRNAPRNPTVSADHARKAFQSDRQSLTASAVNARKAFQNGRQNRMDSADSGLKARRNDPQSPTGVGAVQAADPEPG